MIVTINTDAAYHSQFKVGAFAFWIVSNAGRISHSGALKNRLGCPNEAELQCIINALHTLRKAELKGITKIIINTDSMNSIHLIKNDKEKIRKYRLKHLAATAHKFRTIQYQYFKQIEIEFRHVKSHRDTLTARAWVNDWCDKAAKEQLWKKINN